MAYDTENQKAYVVDGQDGVLVKMDLLADGSLADTGGDPGKVISSMALPTEI